MATTRPPRTDATIYTTVAASLGDERLDIAMRKAEIEAMETAYLMAISDKRVVMITAVRVTGIEEV